MRRPNKQKPPYSGSLAVPIGHSVVRVKLPKASDYEIGQAAQAEATYKNLPIKVDLVRIEGGWDLKQ